MAQGIPDASFETGCQGSANSVAGTVTDFLKFLGTEGGTCTVRDKIYTFSKTAFASFATIADDTLLQISQSTFNPFQHSIKLSNSGGFQPGPYDFDYSISVAPGNPHLYIKDWFTSAEPVDPFASEYTLETNTDPSGGPAAVIFPSMAITPKVTFPGKPTSADFFNELVVVAGKAGPNGFTNTVTQAQHMKTVPGPLPLLGAAAAFGFSRKLRARIKTMA